MAGRREAPEPALGLDPRVPAIHVFSLGQLSKSWMPGEQGLCSGRRSRTRVPGMTSLWRCYDDKAAVSAPALWRNMPR